MSSEQLASRAKKLFASFCSVAFVVVKLVPPTLSVIHLFGVGALLLTPFSIYPILQFSLSFLVATLDFWSEICLVNIWPTSIRLWIFYILALAPEFLTSLSLFWSFYLFFLLPLTLIVSERDFKSVGRPRLMGIISGGWIKLEKTRLDNSNNQHFQFTAMCIFIKSLHFHAYKCQESNRRVCFFRLLLSKLSPPGPNIPTRFKSASPKQKNTRPP